MKKASLLAVFAAVGVLGMMGCAHGDLEKKVDADVAAEKNIKSRADLNAEVGKTIVSAPGLNNQQRVELKSLGTKTRAEIADLGTQSLKLRAVLIKDLMAADYNDEEVSIVKSKIKEVEDKRLKVIFTAVAKAKDILGHDNLPNNRQVMDDFFQDEVLRNEVQ